MKEKERIDRKNAEKKVHIIAESLRWFLNSAHL